MTQAQIEAIEQVRKILIEHFDSWLLTYRITDERMGSKIHHDWHGHVSDVLGLSVITQNRLTEFTSLRGNNANSQ